MAPARRGRVVVIRSATAIAVLVTSLASCTPAERQMVTTIETDAIKLADAACVATHLLLPDPDIEALCVTEEALRPRIQSMILECRARAIADNACTGEGGACPAHP